MADFIQTLARGRPAIDDHYVRPAPSLSSAVRHTITAMRIGLVGCVKTKAQHATRAEDLYVSALFVGRRHYVEASCDSRFILSALHGLVSPETLLEPYEQTLVGKPRAYKRRWAQDVLKDIDALALDFATTTFEIHAGAEYRSFGLVDGLLSRGGDVVMPVEHLGQGAQHAFYGRDQIDDGDRVHSADMRGSALKALIPSSGYSRLANYLRDVRESHVISLSLAQIEEILAKPLPPSARKHRAWWANDRSGSHTHARAWMSVGWIVDQVDLRAGTIRFARNSV